MIIEIHYQGCPVGELEFDGDLNLSDFNFSARIESKMNSERFKAVDNVVPMYNNKVYTPPKCNKRIQTRRINLEKKPYKKQSFVRPKAEYSNTTEMQKELQNIN